MEQIPVYRPWLDAEEQEAAREALEMGWLGMGSYVGDFERAIQDLCCANDRHVAAVSTGHAALHLAMLLVGAEAGDEIITPSFNNIADIQAILATGARPVFCDILDDTLSIDVDAAEALISEKTKAIIAMDYGCHTCDHNKLKSLAKSKNVRIIHDAAHSLGSFYNGEAVGSFSDITMFSFDPVKTITTIDGGALIVNSESELTALHEMRLIGMQQAPSVMYRNSRAWNYDVQRLGFRYHLANLHAAIGLAQLKKFPRIASTRKSAFDLYIEGLKGVTGLTIPKQDVSDAVPFMFYVRVLEGRRDDFRSFLQERGVDTGVHWQPAHGFSLFRGERCGPLSITNRVGDEIVSLPFHSGMRLDWQEKVIDTARAFFA